MPDEQYRKVLERFQKVARRLTQFELQKLGPQDAEFSPDELAEQLFEHRGTAFFLGMYSRTGLIDALEEYGIFSILRQKGFPDAVLTLEVNDPYRQRLTITSAPGTQHRHLLIDLVIHEGTLRPRHDLCDGSGKESYRALIIDWLCLQNPLETFTLQRPRLPGQEHPGLGIGKEVLALLTIMAGRLEKDVLVNIPRHYHNAHLYQREFHFFDPFREGEFKALERDIAGHPLPVRAWSVEKGLVTDERLQRPFEWHGEEEILPIKDTLSCYFNSKEYLKLEQKAFESCQFSAAWERFDPAWLGT